MPARAVSITLGGEQQTPEGQAELLAQVLSALNPIAHMVDHLRLKKVRGRGHRAEP